MATPSRACRAPLSLSASLSRLDLSSTRPTAAHAPLTHTRHESTLRRQRKKWNIPPAPITPEERAAVTPTASSGRSHRPRAAPLAGDTVVYNPPSSSPNVYHTPSLFLPKDDPRRKLLQQQQQQRAAPAVAPAPSASSAVSDAAVAPLPPKIWGGWEKMYHLGPAEIEEMRALRKQDEKTWTRSALARKFNCGTAFVGMVVQASDKRRTELAKNLERWQKFVWGPKRRKARVERQKRRELWKVD